MIRKDSLGREWKLIAARPRPDHGPEFDYEPIEFAPEIELSPMAADCFHDSMQIGSVVDPLIRSIRTRTAEATIERIRSAGMRIETSGPSFVVKTLGNKIAEDDAKLLTMLKADVVRLLNT